MVILKVEREEAAAADPSVPHFGSVQMWALFWFPACPYLMQASYRRVNLIQAISKLLLDVYGTRSFFTILTRVYRSSVHSIYLLTETCARIFTYPAYTCTYIHVPLHTSTYLHLPAHIFTNPHITSRTLTYLQISSRTPTYLHMPSCTPTYLHIPSRTPTYLHIPSRTLTYLHIPSRTLT